MINFDQMDIETGLKIISGLTALIAITLRIWESFSNLKKKQAIKMDLEILELTKKNETLGSDLIENSLTDRISKMYIDTSSMIDNFRNFLIGLVLFLGFSWWSINIFSNQTIFNPKIILTGFMAAIGLALMFDRDRKNSKDKTNDVPFLCLRFLRKVIL